MDSATWIPLATAALVVLTVIVVSAVVVGLARAGRRRLEHELRDSRAELESLRARVEKLAAQVGDRSSASPSTSVPPSRTSQFVITSLMDGRAPAGLATRGGGAEGGADEGAQPQRLSAGQFASVAVGESLVRLLSLGYGVGRALSPESRNRIRFAVRQEVRRSRRQRRRDLKEARRTMRAQQAHEEGPDRADAAAHRDADAA